MLRKIQISPDIIKKVKYFENSVVIYATNELWVCSPNQDLTPNEQGLITLDLKDKCETK